MKVTSKYMTTKKLSTAINPDNTAQSLAPVATSPCHHASRGYLDELRHMAAETKTIATHDNAKTTTKEPATNGFPTPHPASMHPPLKSQTRASGVPISQNAHQRAMSPAANLARNFMGSDERRPQLIVVELFPILASDSRGR